jgi:hypothetical protein
MQMLTPRCLLLVPLAVVAAGCGGILSPSSSGFGQENASNLARQIASSAASAINWSISSSKTAAVIAPGAGLLAAPQSLVQPQGWSCNSAYTSCLVYYSYSSSLACPGGGRTSVSGVLSGSLSVGTFGANGSLSVQQTLGFLDCVYLADHPTNGDPYISDAGTITFTGTHVSFSISENGGTITSTRDNKDRYSCQEHVNVIYSDLTGGSYSGNMTCVPGNAYTMSGSF